jgi:hypothetical protein
MSWGKSNIPTSSPTVAGVDANDMSTNEQARPVKWFAGLEWCELTWVVDKVYNQRTEEIRQKAGKGKETTTGYRYYGDVAGIACLGLADKILAFESGNTVIWTGSITRPDNPAHPDYWRTIITTSVAKVGFYWGRADQPVDDLLLAGIGAADSTLAHPAYRNQCLVVLQNYFFGENTETVPSTRVLVWRAPRPALGNFAPQFSEGGESVVAAQLELATSPIFGAGISAKHFIAAEWESISADVLASIGGLSPSLDRAVPLRDVVKDLQSYYDGWTRFDNGRLKPGRFPHDGTVPAGLTELSVHDFIDHPDVSAGTPSSTVNDVRVIYRDRYDLLENKPATSSASANVKARKGHEPKSMEMPAFITENQASRFAAEAAATGAEGEWGGEGLRVRTPRAKWTNGPRLQAGDNFSLDLIAPQVDQVSRITRRVDYFRTAPTLDFVAEHGVYPTPYVAPTNLRPDIGKVIPTEIVQARVLELTPDLAGTLLGLPVAFLAKRPKSKFEGAAITAANIIGFNVWYGGAAGSTYDTIGHMSGWGVRGTLREALASDTGDVVVKLALDADNLDIGRIVAQSAEGQLNDNLLVVIGDELFSAGAISLSGLNHDLSCKRVRLGSLPAAHALGAEAWIVWRDELRTFMHAGFVENQSRYFKLQPYTQTAVIELADADPLLYHFRDRTDELPVIVLGALPATPTTGVTYSISGQISDVNGDLVSYQVQAVKLVASGGAVDQEITLQAGDVKPDSKALMSFKAPVVFPSAGVWVIVSRAYDERSGFREVRSAEMNVALGTGLFGPDDGVIPNSVTSVVLTPGIGLIVAEWANPTNTALARVLIYANSAAVKPASPAAVAASPQQFYFFQGLPSSATRYFWFEVEAKNGRKSAIAGPYSATTRAGIDLTDIVPGMEMVGIVDALPAAAGYTGPKAVLLTTNGKLYRYSGGAWTAAVPAADVSGQLTDAQLSAIAAAKIAGQLTDAQISAIAAAKVSGQLTDAQIAAIAAAKVTGQIGSTQIADDAITSPKIAAGAVTASEIAAGAVVAGKIAANAITATELSAGSVTTAKIAAGAVTAGEVAAGAITTVKLSAGAVTANELAAGSVVAGKIAAGSVTATELSAGSVTTSKLAANAVTANELAANAITAGKIAAGAVTATAIGANTIIAQTANIADGVITSAKIASLVADKLAAGDLNAMRLIASLVRGDVKIFNEEDASRLYPTTSHVFSALLGSTDGETVLTNDSLIFEGWRRGDAGFSSSRFGHPSLRMDVSVAGGLSYSGYGPYTWAQFGPAWRVRTDGGSWGDWNFPGWIDHKPTESASRISTWPVNGIGLAGNQSLQIGMRLAVFGGGTVSVSSGGDTWARIFNF